MHINFVLFTKFLEFLAAPADHLKVSAPSQLHGKLDVFKEKKDVWLLDVALVLRTTKEKMVDDELGNIAGDS